MDDIELGDVATFVRVVEAGSFTGAARRLQAPKSSVSRRVRRLEAALDVQLLHRTTRSLALTEAGRSYFARVSSALETLNDAALVAAETREVPRGTVRISAPLDVGAEVLPGLVTRFLDRYPEMRIEVRLSPDKESVQGGGFDLAIRGGRPDDTNLACSKLQTTLFKLFAAPSYVAGAGEPHSVTELE
ncbi:MAG: LysR family transcriptional regulator, partial [Myxococcota bacterium]